MRYAACLALTALIALPALAQSEQPVPNPDYSKDKLMRIFAADVGKPEHEPRVTYEFGAINFKALGMRWRYAYLPLLAPLQGSRFNHVTTNEWPDPFILTGTEIAYRPGTYERRLMTAELKRIDRITRRKSSVVVKP